VCVPWDDQRPSAPALWGQCDVTTQSLRDHGFLSCKAKRSVGGDERAAFQYLKKRMGLAGGGHLALLAS